MLSVNVSANPKPESITWTVDGKTLREKESTEKYEALELVAQGVSLHKTIYYFFSPLLFFNLNNFTVELALLEYLMRQILLYIFLGWHISGNLEDQVRRRGRCQQAFYSESVQQLWRC